MTLDNYWVGVPLRNEIRKIIEDAVEKRIKAGEEKWSLYDQIVHWIILGADCERTHQRKPTYQRRQKTKG